MHLLNAYLSIKSSNRTRLQWICLGRDPVGTPFETILSQKRPLKIVSSQEITTALATENEALLTASCPQNCQSTSRSPDAATNPLPLALPRPCDNESQWSRPGFPCKVMRVKVVSQVFPGPRWPTRLTQGGCGCWHFAALPRTPSPNFHTNHSTSAAVTWEGPPHSTENHMWRRVNRLDTTAKQRIVVNHFATQHLVGPWYNGSKQHPGHELYSRVLL